MEMHHHLMYNQVKNNPYKESGVCMVTQKRTSKTKNKTNQLSAKPPIIIEEEHLIGRVLQPASQSIAVSLIHANGRRYIGIMQQYRRKTDNQWVSRGGRWIPFRNAEEVSQLLQQAYAEGKKGIGTLSRRRQN